MRVASTSTGGNGCSRNAQRPVSDQHKGQHELSAPNTSRPDWSYSKGLGGSVLNALMLWRLFTSLRDLLLRVRDLLIGDRLDDVANMPTQSLASGASASALHPDSLLARFKVEIMSLLTSCATTISQSQWSHHARLRGIS
jgi:hypothetical protein